MRQRRGKKKDNEKVLMVLQECDEVLVVMLIWASSILMIFIGLI